MKNKKQWWGESIKHWQAKDKELDIDVDDDNNENSEKETTTIEWWESFKTWWFYRVELKWINFSQGIKNIIRWTPIIWYDVDFDYRMFFKLTKQKLTFMLKLHEKNKRYVGVERDIELMKLAIKLIERIDSEYYSDEFHNYMKNKYGESEWIFIPIPNSTSSTLTFKHEYIENGTYTQDDYDKEFSEGVRKSADKHLKAKKLLFRILDEKIESWWD